jgi:hypothetical protein
VTLFQPVRCVCQLSLLLGALSITLCGVSPAQNTCQLKSPKGNIKHVIYVQFDNTHFRRDNPSVFLGS